MSTTDLHPQVAENDTRDAVCGARCLLAKSLPTLTGLIVALASVAVMTLAGCANSAGIKPTAVTLAPEAIGLSSTTSADSPAIAADWWQSFGDTTLNGLIDRALVGSPNLKAAQARLQRAQASIDALHANDLPQVGLGVDATRQRYTGNSLYPPPLGGSISNNATVQASASWEFDFFGRNAAAIEAAVGTQRATQADIQAARVLLAANVARNYVNLARLVDQRDVANRSLAQRDETLGLIRQRVGAGL
ncbi:MAG: transporter, partial [Rhizobacter sp.]|nr:transporter [Rhizobacter sp.]